jgi:flagellin
MALVVNTNVPSIASQRFLMESRREMETAMERLSSGKRINTAGDDAAGLAISQRMESQIRGLNMAIRNANDAISLTQTAEGAMSEVTDMLQRMRELSLQSVNGVNNDADRASLDAEVQALIAEINRVAETTTFNNQAILDGSFARTFQIGYNASETFDLALASVNTDDLGLFGSDDSSSDDAATLIGRRITASTGWDAGDIVIDDIELGAVSSSGDIKDMIDVINRDIDTVTATAFNTVVAKTAGTGVVYEGDVAILVGALGSSGDADYLPSKLVQLGASSNMDELVANINAAFDASELVASQTSDGKLVLSNTTGATISILDESGTDAAYDGGTGFLVDADANGADAGSAIEDASSADFTSSTVVTGFIKLQSTDGTKISVDWGNKDASTTGSTTDLGVLGFQKNIEDPAATNNQLIGNQLTSTGVSTALDKSTAGVADLIINDVEIYDATLAPLSTTFQGKLDLINAFQDETNVVASSYLEVTYDMSDTVYIADNKVELNGHSAYYGADLATFVTNINGGTSAHGISAVAYGTNLYLRGEGVNALNIVERSYDISVESTASNVAHTPRTADAESAFAHTITIGATAVTAGRIIAISIGAVTTGVIMTAAATSFTHTVTATESAADVAIAFVNLIHAQMVDDGFTSAVAFGAMVTASGTNQINFVSAAGIASASITISVVNRTASVTAFNVGANASATNYGAIRLTSTDGAEISVELGEGDANSAHGFFEINVGDTTWDTNTPTNLVSNPANSPVSGLSIATSNAASEAIGVLDAALESVASYRANLGAVENRMTHTVDNLSNVVENTSAAQSRIQDADFASEAAALARAQILQQAGTAMLAQANAAPQNVLSLLG